MRMGASDQPAPVLTDRAGLTDEVAHAHGRDPMIVEGYQPSACEEQPRRGQCRLMGRTVVRWAWTDVG